MDTNDKTLADLYCLRAGLSVIAQEKDKVDRIIKNAKDEQAASLRMAESNLQRLKSNKNLAEAAYNYAVRTEKENSEKAAKKFSNSTLRFLFALFSVIAIGLILVGIYVEIFSALIFMSEFEWFDCSKWGWFNKLYGWVPEWLYYLCYWTGLFICGGFCVAGFFGGILPAYDVKAKIEEHNRLAKEKEEAINALGEYAENVSEKEKRLAEAKLAIIEGEKIKPEEEKAAREKFAEEMSKAKKHVQAAVTLYNGLSDTYNSLIDVRDWGNLDLVIFYLETRRADSIKEALQLTDRERQTERIVESVSRASREICRTMDNSINRLRNDMRTGFNGLSKQITLATLTTVSAIRETDAKLDMLSAQQRQQQAYLSNIMSSTNMNNALLQKANESSMQLAAAAEQLRINSDYQTMRLKYGI